MQNVLVEMMVQQSILRLSHIQTFNNSSHTHLQKADFIKCLFTKSRYEQIDICYVITIVKT